MVIFIVKEVSILDSGEMGFYATPFKKREDAEKEIQLIEERLIAEGYEIVFDYKNEVKYKDDNENIYRISIEVEELK